MDETSEPFDEFGHSERNAPNGQPDPLASWLRAGLRALSFLGLWVAILTVIAVMARHALPSLADWVPPLLLKSAIPLIAVGFSYLCLILTLRRTPGQRLVGLSVGLAFVLWGVEQFLGNSALVAFIDDVVVFFFVVDLTIVIRHNLRGPIHEIGPGPRKRKPSETGSGA